MVSLDIQNICTLPLHNIFKTNKNIFLKRSKSKLRNKKVHASYQTLLTYCPEVN